MSLSGKLSEFFKGKLKKYFRNICFENTHAHTLESLSATLIVHSQNIYQVLSIKYIF